MILRSGHRSRSATRSPRSCSSRPRSSSSSAGSSRACRTSAPAGSPARPRRRPTGPAPACSSTSTPSRAASRAWQPFEVLISESQERMLAIVRPDREAPVREVCERWGIPCADDRAGHRRRRHRRPARAAARSCGSRPAALTSDAIVHDRVATAPPRRRRGARARARRRSRAVGLPERGMDPGAVLMALLGSANLASRRPVFEQYDSTVQVNTVAGPGRGAAVLRVKGTTKALVASTDANAAVGGLDPWLGRGHERRRGDPERGDHRGPAARRHELPELRRPDPARRRSGSCPRRSAASATRAGRSACRSPAGTSRCTTNRRPARSCRRPRSASSGSSRTSRTLVGPAFAAAGDADPPRRRGDPGPGRQRVRPARRDAPRRTGRRRSISSGSAVSRPSLREAAAPGLAASMQDVSGGGLAVALAECAIWGGSGPSLRLPVAHSPAVDLFGESPSRVVVTTPPATCAGARAAGPSARPARGAARGDRRQPPGRGSRRGRRHRAPPRRAARASPTRSTIAVADLAHTWEHGLARALDWEAPAAAPEGR